MAETTRLTVTSSTTVTMIFLIASLVLSLSYDIYGEPSTEIQPMGSPDLESFATYDDMRRYFASRNLRSLRYLENPDDDSYIDAFNKHNEQPAELDIDKLRVLKRRPKRATKERKLPNEPLLLKFEIADAVEPTDEIKEIVRQHRSRELGNKQNNTNKVSSTTTRTTQASATRKVRARKVVKSSSKSENKRAGRTKRASFQQPANFKVKMIPFQVEDAREPDEATRNLIRQMRALELERLNAQRAVTVMPKKRAVNELRNKQRPIKLKRARRNAPQTTPEMFKFEIEDAKEPDESLKNLYKMEEARESKQLKQTDRKSSTNDTSTTTTTIATPTDDQDTGTDSDDSNDDDDQHSHESRRFYMYKEAPVMKTRKSLNSLPHEVQKVITHLLTEQQGGKGKAYLKYISADQMDYGHLKSNYHARKIQQQQQPVYGTKLKPSNAYVKYSLPIPVQKIEHNQVHAVPLVEKVRYIYPQNKAHEHAQSYQVQPIVVSEVVTPMPAEVHHTYAADLSRIHSQEHIQTPIQEAIKDVPAPQFRPSKHDPTLEENKLTEDYIQYVPVTPLPNDHLKYEIIGTAPQSYYQSYAKPHIQLLSPQHSQLHETAPVTAPAQAQAPVIKIEYHASSDAIKENYKDLQEYKELSTLMGKSPEDQIHGLTYLLAKEMQSKLQQRQSKKFNDEEERPQDSTSPILFHPKNAQILKQQKISSSSYLPGHLMGLGKAKEYIPIVENVSSGEQSKINIHYEPIKEATEENPKETRSHEFYEYGGLSPNYDVVHASKANVVQPKLIVEQIIHHPIPVKHASHENLAQQPYGQHNAEVKLGAGLKLAGDNVHYGVHHGEHNQALQYASKYAFGYRIRDFHTGNDFGHKQNRDLDGVTRGQYHILLPDGRIQNVIYHADDTGFHADVSFQSGH